MNQPRFPNPWSHLKKLRQERFQERRRELSGYFEAATPVALRVDRLYHEWLEEVAEPVQDAQKAANASAAYWWRVTERLRGFESLTPPKPANRYHKLFSDALWNASQGSEIAKNGFRFNKFYEVGRGMEFMDRYVALMAGAEQELGRLVKKYRLIDEQSETQGGGSSC